MIRIPIKKHLHSYLSSKLPQQKVFIKAPTQLEIFESPELRIRQAISKCLTPMLRCDNGFKPGDIKFEKYILMLFVPSDAMVKRGRVYLPLKAVHLLNELIRVEMLNELGMLVDKAIHEEKRIDLTILEFMSRHNIDEDDIHFDSLKKALYRERQTFARHFELPATSIGTLDIGYHQNMIANR